MMGIIVEVQIQKCCGQFHFFSYANEVYKNWFQLYKHENKISSEKNNTSLQKNVATSLKNLLYWKVKIFEGYFFYLYVFKIFIH